MNVEHGGNLLMGIAVDYMEIKNGPVSGRQSIQRIQDLFARQSLHNAVVAFRFVLRLQFRGPEITYAGTQTVNRRVDHHPAQPKTKWLIAGVEMYPRENLEEGIADHLFCRFRMADITPGDRHGVVVKHCEKPMLACPHILTATVDQVIQMFLRHFDLLHDMQVARVASARKITGIG